jgi:hypothetical protein
MVKGEGNFFTVACPLSIATDCQGTGSCVLVHMLGKRMFQSRTNGKNRTLLGVVKELGLVFWHRCRETRCFIWGVPVPIGAKQF